MNSDLEPSELSVELVLHACLGMVFAVAIAVMVFWPHVQTMTV